MNTSDPTLFLDFASADPRLVGHRLARQRRQQNLTPHQQALSFGMDLKALMALCLCRIPWNEAEVAEIAARLLIRS